MSLFVRELMLRDVVVLDPRTPLRKAAAAMARSRRGILVIADDERVHGLVTLRQLVFGAEAAAQGHPVNGIGDLAHQRFILSWGRESLEELAPRLVQAGVRCAVVLGEDGGVAGIITTLELTNGARRRSRRLRAVDVASEDSFPASDAPSWIGSLAG